MRLGQVLIALAIASAFLAAGFATHHYSSIQPSPAPMGEAIDPPQIPPVPNIVTVRDEEGGPDLRRDYELLKLVDPVTGNLPLDIFKREQEFASSLPVRDEPVLFSDLDKGGNLSGWMYRGPYDLGGRTRAFTIDASDPSQQTFLAGGVSGGMWRTTDEGANWTMVTGSTQLHSVSTVAQDTRPGRENVWYYGTGELSGNSAWGGGNSSYRGDGIFKSIDSGTTWTLLPSTSGANPEDFSDIWQYVSRVAVDPSNLVEDEVYAAIFGQIQRSVDGGTTWTPVLGVAASPWSSYTDVIVSPTGVVYASLSSAGGQKGIFRSTDGITWADVTPAGLTNFDRIILATAPSNQNIMYAYVAEVHGTAFAGIYRYDYISGDGSGAGGNWQDRSASLTNLCCGFYGPYNVNTQGSYCMSLAIKPDDPNTVYLGGVQLTRSTDGFATATNATRIGGWLYPDNSDPEQHADQHGVFFLPGSSDIAYTNSDGGVHKTMNINANNVGWTSLNNGYNTSQFYTVAIDENTSGSNIVIGGTQDNGTQWANAINPTGAWDETWGGDGSYCAVANVDWPVAEYYFSYQNGKVYYAGLDATGFRSEWTRVDPTGANNYLFINPYILDPNDENIMYIATSNGVWRNTDLRGLRASSMFSNSTKTLHWGQLTTVPVDDYISALEVTKNGARTLYYGTAEGGLYRVDNSHTSPGSTVPTTLVSPSTGYVSSIAADPQNDQHLLVSFSNYNVQSIWETQDGGASWTDIEGNLAGSDGPSVRSVHILHRAGNEIWFAGTSVGLYSKIPTDLNWEREADDLIGTVVVDDLTSRPSDGLVVVGTHGRGIYSIQIPEGTVSAEYLSLDGAERTQDGVAVFWHASRAMNNHRVYVYRQEAFGERVQLNTVALMGDQTSFVDATAPAGEASYMLKLISPTGNETWFGPISVGVAGSGTRFSLAAASPNPFRTESSLAFDLPRSGNVQVSIFDIRGRLVRTLKDGVLSDGTHRAVWDGRTDSNVRAAAGVYYVNVQYEDNVRTQKLVLIK